MKNTLAIRLTAMMALMLAFPAISLAQDENSANSQDQAAEQQEVNPKTALVQAIQANQWENAIQIADTILESDPNNTEVLSLLGAALAQNNQNERAETVLLKVIENTPDDPQANNNLCYIKYTLKRKDAADACVKAAKLNPDKADIQKLTAQALEANKKPDEARAYYVKSWELNHDDLVALTAATSIDFGKNDYQAAYDLTTKALDSNINNAVLYLNALVAANKLGRYEDAIKLADKGYPMFKDDGMLLNKAEALYQLNRLDEAEKIITELEKVISEKSVNGPKFNLLSTRVLLAQSCNLDQSTTCQLDNEDECCKRERAALEKITSVKDHKTLKKDLELPLVLGMAQMVNGNLKEAEANFALAHENQPDRIDITAAMAVNLFMFGDKRDHETSMVYLSKVLEQSNDFANIDYVRQTYKWPPRMLDNLQLMLDKRKKDAEAAERAAHAGCHCDMAQSHHPLGMGTIIAFLLAMLAGLGLRRKAQ